MIRRQPLLPADVRSRLDLSHDTVLDAHATADGWAVATRRTLHIDKGAQEPPVVLAWHEIESFKLRDDEVLQIAHVDGNQSLVTIPGGGSLRFASLLREQLRHSIVHVEVVHDAPAPIRVVVRRGDNDALFVQIVADGIDLDRPEIAALVSQAEQRAADAIGWRENLLK